MRQSVFFLMLVISFLVYAEDSVPNRVLYFHLNPRHPEFAGLPAKNVVTSFTTNSIGVQQLNLQTQDGGTVSIQFQSRENLRSFVMDMTEGNIGRAQILPKSGSGVASDESVITSDRIERLAPGQQPGLRVSHPIQRAANDVNDIAEGKSRPRSDGEPLIPERHSTGVRMLSDTTFKPGDPAKGELKGAKAR